MIGLRRRRVKEEPAPDAEETAEQLRLRALVGQVATKVDAAKAALSRIDALNNALKEHPNGTH